MIKRADELDTLLAGPPVSREDVARVVWQAYARTQPGLSGGPDKWATTAADAVLRLFEGGE
jgi:hypothetical protein